MNNIGAENAPARRGDGGAGVSERASWKNKLDHTSCSFLASLPCAPEPGTNLSVESSARRSTARRERSRLPPAAGKARDEPGVVEVASTTFRPSTPSCAARREGGGGRGSLETYEERTSTEGRRLSARLEARGENTPGSPRDVSEGGSRNISQGEKKIVFKKKKKKEKKKKKNIYTLFTLCFLLFP